MRVLSDEVLSLNTFAPASSDRAFFFGADKPSRVVHLPAERLESLGGGARQFSRHTIPFAASTVKRGWAMSVQILQGDCLEMMRTLPDQSFQCCVTSPPYFGLRNYHADGQIGLEKTPAEYVANLVSVFREVRRTLKDDGTLWLNLGDSYAGSWGAQGKNPNGGMSDNQIAAHPQIVSGTGSMGRFRPGSGRADGEVDERGQRNRDGIGAVPGLKPKDLMLIPPRVAIALQEDGWYLRAACPWIKRNGMPDSTSDRPTQCIETLFMLTKSRRCYYDAEAVKKAARTGANGRRFDQGKTAEHQLYRASTKPRTENGTRLRRTSDWFFESWQGLLLDQEDEPMAFVVNTRPYKEAHFATFPPDLVRPCILASTSEHGECPSCGKPFSRDTKHTPMVIDRSDRTHELGRTRSSGTMVSPAATETLGWSAGCSCGLPPVPQSVIDPFGGAGTTGLVAKELGRHATLCELNFDYANLARRRCGMTLILEDEA